MSDRQYIAEINDIDQRRARFDLILLHDVSVSSTNKINEGSFLPLRLLFSLHVTITYMRSENCTGW